MRFLRLILLNIILCMVDLSANLPEIDTLLRSCPQVTQVKEITKMNGGYEALSFCIETVDKKYVFRIFRSVQTLEENRGEIHAMRSAAAAGIAPAIHYVAEDDSSILMEYVEGGTLTLEAAKKPENIKNIAGMIRKTHALEKNPYPRESMIEYFEKRISALSNKGHLAEALPLLQTLGSQLSKMDAPKVQLHGDLHFRNIFFAPGFFIDWSYTRWDDPFYDLSYFALYHGYTELEEQLLLEAYLEHLPSAEEMERYTIIKKINLIYISLMNQSTADEMIAQKPQPIDSSHPIQSWSYYLQLFERDIEELSAQILHDWSRLSFQMAQY